jgi:hypothetical protein
LRRPIRLFVTKFVDGQPVRFPKAVCRAGVPVDLHLRFEQVSNPLAQFGDCFAIPKDIGTMKNGSQ